MARAIVSIILKQLDSITSEERNLMSGVETEIGRLKSKFMEIQGALEDAEEKQFQEEAQRYCLGEVKEICYDIEDVLDDWKSALKEQQTADDGAETPVTSAPKRKVRLPGFSSQVALRHDISSRIEDISQTLDHIKIKSRFESKEKETIKQAVDGSMLQGCKEDVIRTLLGGTNEEEGIPTVAIVGMEGSGKTTLARLIYDDLKIHKHFDKKFWICASDPSTPLKTHLNKIHEQIKKKNFLLVLDDVGIDHDVDWQPLKSTSQFAGSRILVTTREEWVALNMKSYCIFRFDKLSDDGCWLILSQVAFAGRNRTSIENLEDIGKEIAKKCKGFPLAAKILGGLLQNKERREEWQAVLDDEIWNQNLDYTPLLLSYRDLPLAIRQCLLYCAIFPKNYRISPDELVQHWMIQGYLGSDDNLGTELKGEDYFKCLAARFFQDFDKDASGNIICCKMHDIVHNFVRFLTNDEFVTKEIVEDLTLDLSSRKPRHLTLVIDNCSSFPLPIYGTEKLRSLVAVSDQAEFNKTTNEATQKLFRASKRLRLLEFDSIYLDTKKFDLDKRNLIHLRYLSFKYCFSIEALLEAVCELPNLQSLNLEKCILDKLPVGIGKLMNLRYLCTKGCLGLTCYPKGISNLTSLVRLSDVKMRADRNHADEFSIGDLENLNLLGGNLCVELIGDAIDWAEVERAKLHNKKDLKRMEIWLCSPQMKKDEIFQALNPPFNLPVEIFDYQRWMTRKMQFAMGKSRVAANE